MRNAEPGGNRPKPPPRSARRQALRLLRIAAAIVVGCEVFYLVAMNVFLSTPLFEKLIDATPMIVDIHYRRGWSFFPTRIHAQDLSIRATDAHVEWILRFDEIDFDCSLLALARQQFHVTRARGNGITFRARMKVASPEALPDKVARLPSIDSLGQVAFIPSDPPYPGEWDDKKWHLWTVQIDDAIAEHVREVWIESGRFEGDARVTGSFLLKPMRAAEVGPAHVDVRHGRAQLDALTVAEPLRASIDFELSRFDPRTLSGADIFHHITLSVDAATVVPDLDNLGLDLPDEGQLRGELAIPRLALRIDKGVLRDDTRIEARSSNVLGTTAAHAVSGALDLTATVLHDKLAASVSLDRVDADFVVAVPHALVAVDSAALDLKSPFTDLHGRVDLPALEIPRAERLAADVLKGAPVRVARGELHGSLHAEGWRAEKRVRGNLDLHGTGLDVGAEKLRVRGDLNVAAAVGDFRFDPARATDVHVAFDLPRAAVSRSASPADAIVRADGLRAELEGRAMTADDPLRSVHASVAIPDGEILDRDSARAALGLDPKLRLAARRARFSASAEVTLDGTHGNGAFELRAPGLGLTYEDRRLALDLTAHARAHAADWRSGTLSLDEGRIAATHLVLADDESPSALSVARVSLTAESPALAVKDPLARLQVVAAIDGGRMNTSSALDDILPPGSLALASKGGATFDADLAAEIVRHVARGAASIDVKGIGVAEKKLRVAGDVRATADVSRWDLDRKTVGGDVSLTAGNLSGSFDPTSPITNFTVDKVDVHASAAALSLADPSMRGVDYGVKIGRAELVDATALNTFLPSPKILAVESGHAVISGEIATSGPARTAGGQVVVSLDDGGLRLHETHLAGDFALFVHARGFDPDHAAVNIEGSRLTMRNVRVSGASTDTSAWSGDLTVESGTLGLAPNPRLEGDLALQARDASPILGVLFRDSLPKFVAQLTAMPSFTALTHIAIEPENLTVSDLFASGGDIALRGTYVVRGPDRDSAFVVQKGPWSVGVSLDNGGTHLRLFGLDRWYGEHARQALAPR